MNRLLLSVLLLLAVCCQLPAAPWLSSCSSGVADSSAADTLPRVVPHQRPRVAVVLSGGGAKGMAHIGVLKVLERAGTALSAVSTPWDSRQHNSTRWCAARTGLSS